MFGIFDGFVPNFFLHFDRDHSVCFKFMVKLNFSVVEIQKEFVNIEFRQASSSIKLSIRIYCKYSVLRNICGSESVGEKCTVLSSIVFTTSSAFKFSMYL